MSDLRTEFGRRMQYLRKRAGFSQGQLAGILGCDLTTVSKIERGIHGPRFDLFTKIVTALKAHPREFFEFPWPPKKK